MIPLFDAIIVQPHEITEIKKAGIIIPTTIAQKNLRGTVLLAGPDALSCKQGDTVVYDPSMGSHFENDEIKMVLMREGDVMIIFEKE